MRTTRVLRSGTLATAAAIAALTTSAGPAGAATTPTPTLKLGAPSSLALRPVAADDDSAPQVRLQLTLTRTGAAAPDRTRLTIDTTQLAGVADFASLDAGPSSCTATGRVFTCDVESLPWWGPGGGLGLTVNLTTAKGAPIGTSGSLAVTETTADGTSSAALTRVVIGGTDLKLQPVEGQPDLKVNGTFTRDLRVANQGQLTAPRLVVVFTATTGLLFPKYGNCEYGDRIEADRGPATFHAAVCTVDTALAPGQSAHLDPVTFTAGRTALADSMDIQVAPGESDAVKRIRQDYRLVRGKGPLLTVEGGPGHPAPAAGPVTDVNPSDAYVSLDAHTANTADFQAVAHWKADATKKAGTLQVGLSNRGPASFNDFRSGGEGETFVDVALPKGVTVTKVPAGCQQLVKASNHYSCGTGLWLASGSRHLFDFGLALDPGTGKVPVPVSLQDQGSYIEKKPFAVKPFDPNPRDNLTTVTIGS
ncbi:hypothetical protein GCM10010430_09960 [Kitasatospora cystarginea]|uniref:Uncharacterized protein n=1 Tax=Kitasatospora cystarginea TaxID=58350 RepID=A0ABN3DI51_9ACTN